jgi:uncharacterized protein YecE (DUF72 family)
MSSHDSHSPNISVGPAGWSYPHWDGVFYPRSKPKTFHPLAHLSQYFGAVEINTSFYQPLKPELAQLWASLVEQRQGFLFTAKLSRRFTHDRILEPAEVASFCEGLRPLKRAGRLGALLMQFPWSFRFTQENRDHLIRLRRAFHEFPLVAELRHVSWLGDEALGTLMDYKIGFCNIDQPDHPRAMPATSILTTGLAYVRLHGRGEAGAWMQDFSGPRERVVRNDYLYSPADLADWKTRIDKLARHAQRVVVVFNNDARAKSLVNGLQMQALLGEAPKRVPRELVMRFPQDLASFSPMRPVQRALFEEAPLESVGFAGANAA